MARYTVTRCQDGHLIYSGQDVWAAVVAATPHLNARDPINFWKIEEPKPTCLAGKWLRRGAYSIFGATIAHVIGLPFPIGLALTVFVTLVLAESEAMN